MLSALLEAAATLASLNLVFLGIISTAYQQDKQRDHGKGPTHYRRLAAVALTAFVLGIVDVAVTALALLDVGTQGALEPFAVVGFFVQLVALASLAGYSVRSIL